MDLWKILELWSDFFLSIIWSASRKFPGNHIIMFKCFHVGQTKDKPDLNDYQSKRLTPHKVNELICTKYYSYRSEFLSWNFSKYDWNAISIAIPHVEGIPIRSNTTTRRLIFAAQVLRNLKHLQLLDCVYPSWHFALCNGPVNNEEAKNWKEPPIQYKRLVFKHPLRTRWSERIKKRENQILR